MITEDGETERALMLASVIEEKKKRERRTYKQGSRKEMFTRHGKKIPGRVNDCN